MSTEPIAPGARLLPLLAAMAAAVTAGFLGRVIEPKLLMAAVMGVIVMVLIRVYPMVTLFALAAPACVARGHPVQADPARSGRRAEPDRPAERRVLRRSRAPAAGPAARRQRVLAGADDHPRRLLPRPRRHEPPVLAGDRRGRARHGQVGLGVRRVRADPSRPPRCAPVCSSCCGSWSAARCCPCSTACISCSTTSAVRICCTAGCASSPPSTTRTTTASISSSCSLLRGGCATWSILCSGEWSISSGWPRSRRSPSPSAAARTPRWRLSSSPSACGASACSIALSVIGAAVLLAAPRVITRVTDLVNPREGGNQGNSLLGRLSIWSSELEQFGHKPFLGHGWGYTLASQDKASHNDYLRLMVEGGVLGLLSIVAVMYSLVRAAWRASRGRLDLPRAVPRSRARVRDRQRRHQHDRQGRIPVLLLADDRDRAPVGRRGAAARPGRPGRA